jgi:hypothetical protein
MAVDLIADGAPEHVMTIHEVTDFPSLVRFSQQKQQRGLPENLRQIIRWLHGGVTITIPKLTKWAKDLGVRLRLNILTARTYTHVGTTPQESRTCYRTSSEATKYELQLQCFQLAISFTAAADGKSSTASEFPRTPECLKDLIAMLRSPSGLAMCPFGNDFMRGNIELAPSGLRDLKPQVVQLLALMELHQHGFRYAAGSCQKSLTLAYTALAKEVYEQRAAAAAQRAAAAASHDLATFEKLADALQHNPVLKSPLGWWLLSLFTASPLTVSPGGAQSTPTEGALRMAASNCTLQAAERIATDFLEFVGKHDLHEAVLSMTPTQMQVVAMFHAQLKIRPRKRIQLSERWECLQQKQMYVAACKAESPAVPHFAVVADAGVGAAVLQAPVVCQLCGSGC